MKGSVLPLTNLDKVLIVCSTQTFARYFTACFKSAVKARISHPGGRVAEAFFGASVAHNNHKIGVNP
ncbi:hypothetical protein ALP39_200254 [Pseudomonas marginalis pv. marginalis]|nr:hypothetical protein ALP39_200254 [Pseudomonas marginalis pv. marginalis]